MKRIALVLSALAILAGISACGQSAAPSASASSPVTPSPSPSPTINYQQQYLSDVAPSNADAGKLNAYITANPNGTFADEAPLLKALYDDFVTMGRSLLQQQWPTNASADIHSRLVHRGRGQPHPSCERRNRSDRHVTVRPRQLCGHCRGAGHSCLPRATGRAIGGLRDETDRTRPVNLRRQLYPEPRQDHSLRGVGPEPEVLQDRPVERSRPVSEMAPAVSPPATREDDRAATPGTPAMPWCSWHGSSLSRSSWASSPGSSSWSISTT